MPLPDVIVKRFLTYAEHQREAQLEALRLQEVALAPDNEGACRYKHTGWGRFRHLVGVDPVDLGGNLILPAWTVTHFKCGCFIETKGGHGFATWIFQDANSRSMQLRMHEKIRPIHVPLHQSFVLLRVASTDNQVILTRDKPDELFEPEYFALHAANLALLEFFVVSCCRFFCLLDGDTCSVFSLDFLRMRLFSNLEVLFDI